MTKIGRLRGGVRGGILVCEKIVVPLHTFSEKIMEPTALHIENLDPQDAGTAHLLAGFGEVLMGVQQKFSQIAIEKQHYKTQVETSQNENSNIIADGKQKKLIAILNAIYESGYTVNCSKKEFMQKAARIFGCEAIADYSKALYNVKNTYQYDDIFSELALVAHNEITKSS